jgi:predicted 2-oxoglutarate/Fe(II)-dependent dioxygenase YbiX
MVAEQIKARRLPVNKSTTIEKLAKTVAKAARSAKFCVAACLPAVDPCVDIRGLGNIRFPLKRAAIKAILAQCRPAPYGKGTQTLVNAKVRNTFQLDADKISLSDKWSATINRAARRAAEELGLPADNLEVSLYKLLVYEKGGFFLPHRDSEKRDGMVASMIVVLPLAFEGGALTVRHGDQEQTLTFAEAANGKVPCYAAFYADCEHEVQRVTRGVRLCLAYNLVLRRTRVQPSAAANRAEPAQPLVDAIGSWVKIQPARPLVFALEHHYTQRGLSLPLLKGADRGLADLVVSAAAKANCFVHLAQVSRHLLQFADDGSFGRGYSWRFREPGPIEIGETYEDELIGSEWTDVRGRKQPWNAIAFDLTAIVASVPIADWKPTSERFEGYTGNEGNSLDRWYHRSAIVLWHRDHHFEVIASSGANHSIPLFESMAAKLARTPKKHLAAARGDCIRFARAIIAVWPQRPVYYGAFAAAETSVEQGFIEQLLTLHDRDVIALLLSMLATRDRSLTLSSFVLAACRAFGWSAFTKELKQLITARPERLHSQDIPLRDIQWLCAICCDKSAAPERLALALELSALAVERFCEPRPARPASYRPEEPRRASISETSLPLLLKALVATGRDEDLERVIRFVQSAPEAFNLDDCVLPCLITLISWSKKQRGAVPPGLASWLAAVRQQLERATAGRPAPPADWARPAKVTCTCQYCARLNAFLADPTSEVGRIAAREEMRQHLLHLIRQHESDVKHVLEKKGSPYSLVFTKTNGSYMRAVKRFEMDCRLLRALPRV